MPPTASPPPRMNREQRRAFVKFMKTPEGKAKLARVKRENEAKAARKAELQQIVSDVTMKAADA